MSLSAIWAAYLVQYWIRRRDHLATARSMDRFSESMRVLARRTPLPASSMETPPARSYAVSPARVDAAPGHRQARGRHDLYVGHGQPGRGGDELAACRSSTRQHPLDVVPPPTRGVSRRVRGLVLLAQLAVFLVVSAMAVLGFVVWWAPLLAVVAIGCAVVWVREGVRTERSARSAHGPKPVRRPTSDRAEPAAEVAADVAAASAAAPAQTVEAETVLPEPYGFEGPAAATGSPAACDRRDRRAGRRGRHPADLGPAAGAPPDLHDEGACRAAAARAGRCHPDPDLGRRGRRHPPRRAAAPHRLTDA